MDNYTIQDVHSEYGIQYNPDQEKILKDSNDASKYGYIPEVPRIFLRSHIFGGSHVREERNVLLYDIKEKYFIKKKITTPKLEERLYLEILSNCIDNCFLSRRMSVDPGYVDIEMTSDTISVTSYGLPVPVDIHEYFYTQGQFGTCAELIFGVVGAGGNTDDRITKQSGGVNGYGAKLVNVFSRMFSVEIGDNIRGFHQKVTWKRNMMVKESSILTPSTYQTVGPDQSGKFHIIPVGERYTGPNFVKITWKQDFRKFGIDYFSQEELELYMKYAADASFQGKVIVNFNKIVLDTRSSQNYINLFPKEIGKTALIHYEFKSPPGLQGKELETAIASFQLIPDVELIVLDTPGEGMHISYCNGIYNVDGGVHTDAAYREVLKALKDIMASNKGFDKGLDMGKLDIRDIKKHCTVIINYKCNDPVFKGQDKEKLNKPEPKINIGPDEASKMKKWKLVDVLYKSLTGKNLATISGGRLGRGRVKDDDNFEEANWFGTDKQWETVMVLCEGKSAGGYILKWILATPERKNKYAAFLLKGKVKNITDTGAMEIEANKELRNLINYMGLDYGVDYRTPAGVRTLRYGYIYIMVDADSDGSHILSLLINFFYRAFPTFIMAGRLIFVPTPVLRVLGSSGNTKEIFYNMFDYKEWNEKVNKLAPHKGKFFKGLAAGKDSFAREDSKISDLVVIGFDQLVGQALDVAFKKGLTHERKKWIQFWRDKIDTRVIMQMPGNNPRLKYINASDYINTKLVEYSIDTFARALPSYKDGLKKSQRQLLWYILDEWNFGHSRKDETKIQYIANGAADKSKYHHGNLVDTLGRLASNYPGANNLPLMSPEGQFGTRNKLGADIGASRYVETKPEWFFKYIFDKELMDMVERNIVEDKEVEPKWIPCKIPLHIINGVLGVATAYSLEIPGYHPIDIIMWILQYISDQMVFPMVPWFKGFTGGVELEIFKGKYKKDLRQQVTEDTIHYYEGLTLTTTGIFQHIRNRNEEYTEMVGDKKVKVTHEVADIYISEVPIGVGLASYRSEMEKLCDKVDDQMETTDTPNMTILGWKTAIGLKELKLIERTGLCNITLIDDDSFPIQMRNVYESLKLYCDNMKQLYHDLKEKRLKVLESDIIDEQKIIKLIDLLRSKTIIDDDQPDSIIEQQMLQHGIEFPYYKKLGRRSTSKDGYAEHIKKLENLLKSYQEIYNKHYLLEWHTDLNVISNKLSEMPEYQKLQHHQYPFIPTSINDLLSGKVKSPYKIREELLPESI